MEKDEAYISNLVTYIGYFLKNGIMIDGMKLPFSILDYYSIVKESVSDVASKAQAIKKYILYRNYFIKFAYSNKFLLNEVENVNEVLEAHHAFIKNDQRIVPSEEDIQNILDLLDQYNIPKYNRVVYSALARQAFGYPILPFVNMEEKNMSK